jgi:hypothetical protein
MIPRKKPKIVPRVIGGRLILQSCRSGRRSLRLPAERIMSRADRAASLSAMRRISLIPKRPIAKMARSIPSTRVCDPKVNLSMAVTGSMPIVPRARPRAPIKIAFSVEPEPR